LTFRACQAYLVIVGSGDNTSTFLVALIARAVVMLLGWRNDPEAQLHVVSNVAPTANTGIEIRTREPDNDA
jgi:hypothetical protein